MLQGVFDYLEHLSVSEIRKLYYMLSVLAFKTAQRDALLQVHSPVSTQTVSPPQSALSSTYGSL